VRIGPTWDCGLRGLTPQMEYTATGFSKPIRMIFKALFRPRREVQREYDFSPYFAKTSALRATSRRFVQTRIYRPLNRGMVCASRAGCARCRPAASRPTSSTSSSRCCCCCCLRYEPETLARPRRIFCLQTACCWLARAADERLIKNWKAKLQNRRGPRVWQPYFDLAEVPAQGHGDLRARLLGLPGAPYVVFHFALLAGLMVPMVTCRRR
jgi:hypothetical protein